MDPSQVRKLYEAMSSSGFESLELQVGEHERVRLLLSPKAAAATMAKSQKELDEVAKTPTTITVASERVGVFHFPKKSVSDGDHVTTDQVLGIIRGVSIQDQVTAPTNGEIVSVLVQEGQIVEFGQHLFVLLPAEAK